MITKNKMAACGVCARSLAKFSSLSRSTLLNSIKLRCGQRFGFSTTVLDNKFCGEKSSNVPPTDGTSGNKKEVENAKNGHADLEKQLAEENNNLTLELKEMKDKYLRALAETENVRTRMKKMVDDAKIFGIQGFCKDLLEVSDILGQATESVPQDEMLKNPQLKSLYDGLKITNTQLLKVFGKHGLVKIEPGIGEKFDPFFHEALFPVPAQEGQSEGTIAIIQKTGFKLHDRTIRPALVGVFK